MSHKQWNKCIFIPLRLFESCRASVYCNWGVKNYSTFIYCITCSGLKLFFNLKIWWHLKHPPRPRWRLIMHRLMCAHVCATGVCPAHGYCHGDRPFWRTSQRHLQVTVLLLFLVIKMDYQGPPAPQQRFYTYILLLQCFQRALIGTIKGEERQTDRWMTNWLSTEKVIIHDVPLTLKHK